MKNALKSVAGIFLLLALLTCSTSLRSLEKGDMKLPADPAERGGYIAGLILFPTMLFVASAILYVKAARRGKR